ncbi:hypothetical protein T4C_13898 [Trichinella pseudospiralis]|uniref:Uncharacterized protein n=1 Tax=Trichinella pseudospiralis TaxID=6337 RepID=A0A0V1JLD1_TRIPS|nr:hypothetical protein T4C_13898 [Trichinella pseudospiralis]
MPLGGTPFAISQSMHYGDAYLWPVELWGLHKRIRSEQAGSLTTLRSLAEEDIVDTRFTYGMLAKEHEEYWIVISQALVCMYTVDLKIECQVMSAREIPRHNNSDNDLTKLGS